MTFLVLVALGLAAWRAASLVTSDTITEPLRAAARRRWPVRDGHRRWQVELVHCGRCLSVWTAGICSAVALSCGLLDGWRWTWLAWASSAGVAALIIDLRG